MRTARSLTISSRILCMPPPHNHTPPGNHARPSRQPHMTPGNHTHPPATMQTPRQPWMPPTITHAPWQPHNPRQPCMPPTTMHPLATMHTPQQPHMPPHNHSPPKNHTHTHNHACFPGNNAQPWPCTCPPVNRMTNRCKNITLPQTSFAAVKIQLTLIFRGFLF